MPQQTQWHHPAPAPGYYPDPWWPGRLRLWSGAGWSELTQAMPAERPGARRASGDLDGTSIATFTVCGGLGVLAVLVMVGPAAFLIATVLALLPLPIYALAVLSLNRFHPEPRAALIWTFLAGATAVILVALILNTVGTLILAGVLGESAGGALGAAVIAPVVEEGGKGLVLLVMFLRFRHRLNGILDGIVYACMVGLGFATVENILYYGQALNEGALAGTFVIRGVFSPFAHPLFSAMIGIGLGLASSRTGAWARAAPVVGYVAAVGLHAIWNGSTFTADGLGFVAAFLLVMIPAFAIVITMAVMDGRRERALVLTHLGPEVARGVLTPNDLIALSSLARRRALLARARALHPRAGAAAEKLSVEVIELAFARERVQAGAFSPRYGEARVALAQIQERLSAARWALPPAPAHAPWSGLEGALNPVPLQRVGWGPGREGINGASSMLPVMLPAPSSGGGTNPWQR